MGAFIDTLSAEDTTRVLRLSIGDSRPSYYDSAIAKDQKALDPNTTNAGQVQISLDMEALIILTPKVSLKYVLDFIDQSLSTTSAINEMDFRLMSEVVGLRTKSYAQINGDVIGVIKDFDATRRGFQSAMRLKAGGTNVEIPDLSKVFQTLTDSYQSVSAPEESAVHGRIVDAGLLYNLESGSTERVQELKSWGDVFRTYYVR